MITFIIIEILSHIIEAIIIGIAFYACKNYFEWNASHKVYMISLIGIFVIADIWQLPALYSLDATITIRNQEIAKILDIGPNYPIINTVIPGKFDFLTWLIQALIAFYAGNRMVPNKYAT